VHNDLPLSWVAICDSTDGDSPAFSARTEPGAIRVRGHLSTGTRGWVLRAGADRRRTTITLRVTAVEHQPVRAPDLEFHRYEAVIPVWRSGRYRLRVTHAYLPRHGPGQGLLDPVFEETLQVP
jgi:hypothetical protein